eukprot:Rmarinus@m.26571
MRGERSTSERSTRVLRSRPVELGHQTTSSRRASCAEPPPPVRVRTSSQVAKKLKPANAAPSNVAQGTSLTVKDPSKIPIKDSSVSSRKVSPQSPRVLRSGLLRKNSAGAHGLSISVSSPAPTSPKKPNRNKLMSSPGSTTESVYRFGGSDGEQDSHQIHIRPRRVDVEKSLFVVTETNEDEAIALYGLEKECDIPTNQEEALSLRSFITPPEMANIPTPRSAHSKIKEKRPVTTSGGFLASLCRPPFVRPPFYLRAPPTVDEGTVPNSEVEYELDDEDLGWQHSYVVRHPKCKEVMAKEVMEFAIDRFEKTDMALANEASLLCEPWPGEDWPSAEAAEKHVASGMSAFEELLNVPSCPCGGCAPDTGDLVTDGLYPGTAPVVPLPPGASLNLVNGTDAACTGGTASETSSICSSDATSHSAASASSRLCDVCGSGESSEGNEIVFCDGCDVAVHQGCYGIPTIPHGEWKCEPCTRKIPFDRRTCVICALDGGALKSASPATKSGCRKWVHATCALWTPNLKFRDQERMTPVLGLSGLRVGRHPDKTACEICHDTVGVCVLCGWRGCITALHAECARRAGYHIGTKRERGTGHMSFFVRCEEHSKRFKDVQPLKQHRPRASPSASPSSTPRHTPQQTLPSSPSAKGLNGLSPPRECKFGSGSSEPDVEHSNDSSRRTTRSMETELRPAIRIRSARSDGGVSSTGSRSPCGNENGRRKRRLLVAGVPGDKNGTVAPRRATRSRLRSADQGSVSAVRSTLSHGADANRGSESDSGSGSDHMSVTIKREPAGLESSSEPEDEGDHGHVTPGVAGPPQQLLARTRRPKRTCTTDAVTSSGHDGDKMEVDDGTHGVVCAAVKKESGAAPTLIEKGGQRCEDRQTSSKSLVPKSYNQVNDIDDARACKRRRLDLSAAAPGEVVPVSLQQTEGIELAVPICGFSIPAGGARRFRRLALKAMKDLHSYWATRRRHAGKPLLIRTAVFRETLDGEEEVPRRRRLRHTNSPEDWCTLQSLRQSLETFRLLADLVLRRERLKRRIVEVSMESSRCQAGLPSLFPHAGLATPPSLVVTTAGPATEVPQISPSIATGAASLGSDVSRPTGASGNASVSASSAKQTSVAGNRASEKNSTLPVATHSPNSSRATVGAAKPHPPAPVSAGGANSGNMPPASHRSNPSSSLPHDSSANSVPTSVHQQEALAAYASQIYPYVVGYPTARQSNMPFNITRTSNTVSSGVPASSAGTAPSSSALYNSYLSLAHVASQYTRAASPSPTPPTPTGSTGTASKGTSEDPSNPRGRGRTAAVASASSTSESTASTAAGTVTASNSTQHALRPQPQDPTLAQQYQTAQAQAALSALGYSDYFGTHTTIHPVYLTHLLNTLTPAQLAQLQLQFPVYVTPDSHLDVSPRSPHPVRAATNPLGRSGKVATSVSPANQPLHRPMEASEHPVGNPEEPQQA